MKYKKDKQYRLRGFDYAGEGEYFVTICTKNNMKFFGKIRHEKMILSEIGKIVEKIWKEIPGKFENITLDTHQVMPDNFHGIVRRNLIYQIQNNHSSKKNIINDVPTFKSGIKNNPMELKTDSLGKIIRWFKGRVSFEAKKLNPEFAWQDRFHDRVIRNEKEYYFIVEYIENNPANYGNNELANYFNNLN